MTQLVEKAVFGFFDKLLTFSISSKKFLTARESGGSPPPFHTFPPWLILRGATFSTASTFPHRGERWPEGPDEGAFAIACTQKEPVGPADRLPSPGLYSMAMRLASGTTGTALGRFSSSTPLL